MGLLIMRPAAVPDGGGSWSLRWSFRQARHHMTGPYRLEKPADLTSLNGTLQHGPDGCRSTSILEEHRRRCAGRAGACGVRLSDDAYVFSTR